MDVLNATSRLRENEKAIHFQVLAPVIAVQYEQSDRQS